MKIVETQSPFQSSLLEFGRILEDEREDLNLFECLENEQFDELQEKTVELTAVMNEYVERLHDVRKLLVKAHLQKKKLAIKLNIY
jgi:hypothetical protein